MHRGAGDPRDAPAMNLPCVAGSSYNEITAASRSRHPGGVNVGICDGSVQFVSDNVGIAVWQASGRSLAMNRSPASESRKCTLEF